MNKKITLLLEQEQYSLAITYALLFAGKLRNTVLERILRKTIESGDLDTSMQIVYLLERKLTKDEYIALIMYALEYSDLVMVRRIAKFGQINLKENEIILGKIIAIISDCFRAYNIDGMRKASRLIGQKVPEHAISELLTKSVVNGMFDTAQKLVKLLKRKLTNAELSDILSAQYKNKSFGRTGHFTADLMSEPDRTNTLEALLNYNVLFGNLHFAQEVSKMLKQKLSNKHLEQILKVHVINGWFFETHLKSSTSNEIYTLI